MLFCHVMGSKLIFPEDNENLQLFVSIDMTSVMQSWPKYVTGGQSKKYMVLLCTM